MGCTFSFPRPQYEIAGLDRKNNRFQLSLQYKQPKAYIIYYGLLEYSGLVDYSVYDIIVAADQSGTGVAQARSCGTKVFQYLPYGSRFNTDGFIEDMKSQISSLASQGLADGIFFDECEVGYWNMDYYEDDELAAPFEEGLQEVCRHCRQLGLESIVNGVAAYSNYGTYFLWESFAGYWDTNRLDWSGSGSGTRTKNANGTITYNYNFSKWTLTGSLRIENGCIVNGKSGTMTIDIDMADYIRAGERKQTYPWVYFEWFGEGADDYTLEIYAYIGNDWPYNEETWEKLPKLWKGEPASWNGINKETRYIRLELVFKGADNLRMDNCFLNYDYVYPYYDMDQPNEPADTNRRYWNFNLSHCAYLQEQEADVLCHCYGTRADRERMQYTFTAFKVMGFDSWDFTHPLHQIIRYTDILDDPFGVLLKRIDKGNGKYHGLFTGCEADIDLSKNTYSLTRNEPEYWFDRGLDSFDESMRVYENPLSFTHHTFLMTAEIPYGQTIPGIADGWYVIEVLPPIWQYDWETGDIIWYDDDGKKIEYFYTVYYYPVLPDRLNLKKMYVYDDIFYFYFGMKFGGAVDFLAIKPDRYYIYIGSSELDYGFKGEWFDAPFKAQFMIYNQSLFKWSRVDWEGKPADERDYTNFEYIGNAFLDIEFSEDDSFLRYTLKKSVLGEASTKNMKFYAVVEETAQNYVGLVPENGVDITVDPVGFPNCIQYGQRRHGLFSPHGYYLSEEIELDNPQEGIMIQWAGREPAGTDIDMFVRYKREGDDEFSDYVKAAGNQYFVGYTVTHIQYALSLNTTEGKTTPYVSDVRIFPGKELIPVDYTEGIAEIRAAAGHTVAVTYEH